MNNLDNSEGEAISQEIARPDGYIELPTFLESKLGQGNGQNGIQPPKELTEIDMQIQRCAEVVAEILRDRDTRDARDFELARVVAEARDLISEKTGYKSKGIRQACSRLFKLERSQISRLWHAHTTMQILSPFKSEFSSLPDRITQIRSLAKLPPEVQVGIWRTCDKNAPDGKVVMREVDAEVVQWKLAQSASLKKTKSRKPKYLRIEVDQIKSWMRGLTQAAVEVNRDDKEGALHVLAYMARAMESATCGDGRRETEDYSAHDFRI
jgi:hypothetical protein